jgi:chromosomal replication initiator protein
MIREAEKIIDIVAAASGYSVDDLVGKRRNRHLTAWRHFAMKEVRTRTLLSTTEIGLLFNRDHSSVIYALQKQG